MFAIAARAEIGDRRAVSNRPVAARRVDAHGPWARIESLFERNWIEQRFRCSISELFVEF